MVDSYTPLKSSLSGGISRLATPLSDDVVGPLMLDKMAERFAEREAAKTFVKQAATQSAGRLILGRALTIAAGPVGWIAGLASATITAYFEYKTATWERSAQEYINRTASPATPLPTHAPPPLYAPVNEGVVIQKFPGVDEKREMSLPPSKLNTGLKELPGAYNEEISDPTSVGDPQFLPGDLPSEKIFAPGLANRDRFVGTDVGGIQVASESVHRRTLGSPKNLAEMEWIHIGVNRVLPVLDGEEIVDITQKLFKVAERSILVTTSTLRQSDAVDILEQRIREGIDVKIIVADPTRQTKGVAREASAKRAIAILRKAGAQVLYYPNQTLRHSTSQSRPEYHRKLIVIDDELAFISSSNLTHHPENFDMGVILYGPVVSNVLKVFYADWYSSGGEIQKINGDTRSNFDVRIINNSDLKDDIFSMVLELITSAEESITLAYYLATHPEIRDALIKKRIQAPHVRIRVLAGPEIIELSRFHIKAKVPTNVPSVAQLVEAGIEVKWARMPDKGIVHTKTAVFDRKTIFTGNADLTRRGLEGNTETNVLIFSPELAAIFEDKILEYFDSGMVPISTDPLLALLSRIWTGIESLLINGNRLHYRLDNFLRAVRYPPYRRLIGRRIMGMITRLNSVSPLNIRTVEEAEQSLQNEASKLGMTVVEPPSLFRIRSGDSLVPEVSSLILFGGYYARKAEQIISNPTMLYSMNGDFGRGIYLSPNPKTSIDFGLLRSLQNGGPSSPVAHVFLFRFKGKSLFNLRRDWLKYTSWLQQHHPNALWADKYRGLSKFCTEMGYDGIYLESLDGRGNHTILFYDMDLLKIGGYYLVGKSKSADNPH